MHPENNASIRMRGDSLGVRQYGRAPLELKTCEGGMSFSRKGNYISPIFQRAAKPRRLFKI